MDKIKDLLKIARTLVFGLLRIFNKLGLGGGSEEGAINDNSYYEYLNATYDTVDAIVNSKELEDLLG